MRRNIINHNVSVYNCATFTWPLGFRLDNATQLDKYMKYMNITLERLDKPQPPPCTYTRAHTTQRHTRTPMA
jgi:hypothetical protein